jgi:antitoxin ChpS
MHRTNLRKVGGSVMLAVPPALLEVLELEAGTEVGIGVEGGRLVVEPRRRQSYTLAELLSESGPKRRGSTRQREWVRGKRMGRELI